LKEFFCNRAAGKDLATQDRAGNQVCLGMPMRLARRLSRPVST
jgi:hypothetical protein